ncbi:MAG TPA: arsenate reductase ArsC, partial [Bacteroidota bacterium]|nr:arsenate reductase ArsC [Bacteroidota bacterium]
PIFPGVSQRMHWGFADPSSFTGSHDAKLSKTREVRDLIKSKVLEFIEKETEVKVHGTTV